jgi:hypothetical protein
MAKRKIRDHQDGARTSLLHAIRQWKEAINIHLWPCVMRCANDVNNHMARAGKEFSPIEKFSSVKKKLPLQHLHHFGCPIYVLDPKYRQDIREA